MTRPVLIIEDNADIAECLHYILKMENFETRVARSGEEGLAASLDQEHPPLAILLDVLLPGMSGAELCRRLRREPSTRSIPIIMVSAKASTADIALGLSVGADAYICKPFSVRQLVARVRALTSEKSSEAKSEVDPATESRELPSLTFQIAKPSELQTEAKLNSSGTRKIASSRVSRQLARDDTE